MAGYKEIDMTTWKRSQHCAVFRSCVQPEYCVSFELDISNFLPRIKAKRYSTTFALIYAITKCANEIEEFRYRFMDGKVVLYECVDTAFTYLNQETELFKFVNVPMRDTMAQYVELAANAVKQQTAYFTAPPANNVFIFSPMPWISFTHISHTASGKKDNAVPLFDWGKFFEREGKIILPFAVQAHHSFVDGLHIGRLYERLQRYLDTLKEI